MNKDQIGYQVGRAIVNSHLFGAAATLSFTPAAMIVLSSIPENILNLAPAVFYGLSSWLGAKTFCKDWAIRRELHLKAEEINNNKERYPLEHSNSILIDDASGLENLLDRTQKNEQLEWGTLLKAYNDDGKAIIYSILDFNRAQQFIIWQTIDSINFNATKAKQMGFNGDHHYHPSEIPDSPGWFGASNFAVNYFDRNSSAKHAINLLSFNMPYGPEIIGYNRQFTYIPKDKRQNSKKELVKATPKQIMEYLK